MKKYEYVVNTFDEFFEPIQAYGLVEADSEEEAIEKLAEKEVIRVGWEFLALKEVKDGH